uniref:AAA family ATPase n=1 Tax=Aliarcobacter sp. TaxID=2321116 RepID=UPI004047A74B
MELVYLWVEDYKNIQKQGFNFSPNFDVEFAPVYEDEKLSEKSELKITPKENLLKDFFGKDINVTAIVGENGSGKSSLLEYIISFKKQTDGSIILFKDRDLFISNRVNIKVYYDNEIVEIRDIKEISDKLVYLDSDIYKQYRYSDNFYEILKATPFYHQNQNFKLIANNSESYSMNTLENNINFLILDNLPIKKFIFDYIPLEIEIESIKIDISEDKKDFLEKLLKVINNKKMNVNVFKDSFYLNNEELVKKLVDEKIMSLKIFDDKNRNLFDFSFGEKKLIMDCLIMHNELKSKLKNCLVLLDEPEITLHPFWQKKYVKNIIESINLNTKKDVHIIITSHSPFLLSDLPKENVIFLEKDEKTGKCINATEKMKDFNTFGANIHTLLSHGFFMKDGLMGEFAKKKINQVYNFIVQKDTTFIKTKEEAQNIINLIGEPMLRKELQFLYDEKFEVDEIDKQIREYEEAIEKLKSKKKKND